MENLLVLDIGDRCLRALGDADATKNLKRVEEKIRKNPSLGKKTKPNDPCPCKSGKKYKKCCGAN